MNVEGLTSANVKSHLQIYRRNKQKKQIPSNCSSRNRRGNRSVFCSNSNAACSVVLGVRGTDAALGFGGTDEFKLTTTHAAVEPMRLEAESSAPDTSFVSVGSTASANQEAYKYVSPWSPSGTASVDAVETCGDVDNDNEIVPMVQAEPSAPDTSFFLVGSAASANQEAHNGVSSDPWSPSDSAANLDSVAAFLDLDHYDGVLQETNLSSNNGGRDDGIGLPTEDTEWKP